jgi:hypothetical protein
VETVLGEQEGGEGMIVERDEDREAFILSELVRYIIQDMPSLRSGGARDEGRVMKKERKKTDRKQHCTSCSQAIVTADEAYL